MNIRKGGGGKGPLGGVCQQIGGQTVSAKKQKKDVLIGRGRSSRREPGPNSEGKSSGGGARPNEKRQKRVSTGKILIFDKGSRPGGEGGVVCVGCARGGKDTGQ